MPPPDDRRLRAVTVHERASYGLNRAEYTKLQETEERMWWFRGLHANLLAALRNAGPGPGIAGPVLDAGCGTGGLLAKLAVAAVQDGEAQGMAVYGIDADAAACAAAHAKSGAGCIVGSINALPFADGSIAVIVSADVLCHRGVDEAEALRQFHRCLRPGGMLILNLPAYPWLLSAHDTAVHNARRYTRADIAAKLAAAGFQTVRTTHWNALPFPLMMARRLLTRAAATAAAPESDVHLYPAPVEAAFSAAMAVERSVLNLGFPIPFGGSILAKAVKDG